MRSTATPRHEPHRVAFAEHLWLRDHDGVTATLRPLPEGGSAWSTLRLGEGP